MYLYWEIGVDVVYEVELDVFVGSNCLEGWLVIESEWERCLMRLCGFWNGNR